MGIEDEFEEVRKAINRMLRDAFEGQAARDRPLSVRGSGTRPSRAAGRLPVRRFLVPTPTVPPPPVPEVSTGEMHLFVTIDLGEVAPDVQARVSGRLLRVDIGGPRPRQHLVSLPSAVHPGVRWTIRNGVLDLVLERAERDAPAS